MQSRLSYSQHWLGKIIVPLFLLGTVFLPAFVSAQEPTAPPATPPPPAHSGLYNLIFNSNLDKTAGQTYNKDISLQSRVGAILNIIIGLLGVIAVLLLIYSGFLWLTAGGNDEQVAKAMSIIKQTIIGIVVISLAYTIVAFIISQISTAAK